jgi:anti-anti-sigma factor
MNVSSRLANDNQEVVIDVKGNFDFAVQREFREAYREYKSDLTFRVNLSGTEYMDSSALGMLLLLRKHAGDTTNRVVLSGANGVVSKILSIANFDKLFIIE